MTSIQMAEEKLRQNDQNVEIFEELRNSLKNTKKDRPKSPLNRKTSRISEPDPEISSKKEEPPELSTPLSNQTNPRLTHTRGADAARP